jgi:hypothetical protein
LNIAGWPHDYKNMLLFRRNWADTDLSARLLIHPGDESSNVPIDVLDRCVRELDVLQVKVQQETMMTCHPTTKGLALFLGRSLGAPVRQRGQLHRIGLARNQRLDHRPAAPADDVRDN